MNIATIGSGYVGLVSGACFASYGHVVTCVDIDAKRIEMLKAGRMPIFEPGLEDIIDTNVKSNRLLFTTDLSRAVSEADVVFLAVGTPSRRGDGHADLNFVFQAARDVARALDGFTVVVAKSTVPVGTCDEIERIIREERPDADFAVASNPEFLREGSAIEDFKRPNRIVIGAEDDRTADVMRHVYRPLFLNAPPIFVTTRRSAELIKYASNAFLAMKVTFINEIADLCEKVGANVQDVARGVGMDNRIGSKFLNAGPGYGGSCFPKDTVALMRTAEDARAPIRIIKTVVEVNEARKIAMAEKIAAAFGTDGIEGRTIGILGLTFKPNTDDMRDAPSIKIIERLQEKGAQIKAYDPEGTEQSRDYLTDIIYCDDAYSVAEGADALVIVTEWEQFRSLDLPRLKMALRHPLLIDLRNIYDCDEVREAGLDYVSVGRPSSTDGVASSQ